MSLDEDEKTEFKMCCFIADTEKFEGQLTG